MEGIQKSFIGGINQLASNTQLKPDEYEWGINLRNRFSYIEPINKHVLLDTPIGVKQGGIGIGNVKIIFVQGHAYYQEDGVSFWVQVPNFQLNANADIIYSVAVPGSTLNFVRKAAANIVNPIILTTDFKVAGTPAGVVCQDGISQPCIIEFDFINQIYIGRVLGNYNTWDNQGIAANSREYVPIGLRMMLLNQTLFIQSRDGASVYRSITGRPLDFMIVVDQNGNKLPTELQGGAAQISFAMDFDLITCLQPLNIPDTFVYGTAHNIRFVTADYTNTLFGEPTFRTTAIISAGIVNQYSFVELIGDYAFIDFDSVKSFDAVQLLKFKGRNSIFSIEISRILFDKNTNGPIKQRHCMCTIYNNFALFNIDTNFGNIIAVYDMILEQWVSFDITEVFKVKQFFSIETLTKTKLYAITVKNEVFEMYALSTQKEIPILKTRAFVTQLTNVEHKSQLFRALFNGSTYDGQAILTELVDEQISDNNNNLSVDIPNGLAGVPYPVQPPVFPSNKSQVDTPAFQLKDGLTGKKLAYILSWNNDAQLTEYHMKSTEMSDAVSLKQQHQTNQSVYGS